MKPCYGFCILLVQVCLLFQRASLPQVLAAATATSDDKDDDANSCPVKVESGDDELNSSLKPMDYTIKRVKRIFFTYVQPNISSFYGDQEKRELPQGDQQHEQVQPAFNGRIGKFINLSNKRVRLFVKGPTTEQTFIREFAPLSAHYLTCFPGQVFSFLSIDRQRYLFSWKIEPPLSPNASAGSSRVYVYDPFKGPKCRRLLELTRQERATYEAFKETLAFGQLYENYARRSYLPNAIRQNVVRPMWPAAFFGQVHTVSTRETYFVRAPPSYALEPIFESGQERILQDNEPRMLAAYRAQNQSTLQLTLQVISCAPRVFEIPHFLSKVEVDHILSLASVRTLKESKVGIDGKVHTENARTSKHTWIKREQNQIIDAIYRRAANLLRIDEALLRSRDETENRDVGSDRSIAESLQLVHYSEGQQYVAHQDWISPSIEKPLQANRFATLLVYLNDVPIGGETSFPLWANAFTPQQLNVIPEVGKAILFYSLLPDGNMDELSLHAALPVLKGEKYVVNMWIWDPILETSQLTHLPVTVVNSNAIAGSA